MTKKHYAIIGYNCDLGGSVKGTGEGPAVLRKMGLYDRLADIGVQSSDSGDAISSSDPKEIAAVSALRVPEESSLLDLEKVYLACKSLYQKTAQALDAGKTPLILGGDHSLSVGSVAAVADFYAKQGKKIGLIWVDAHGDLNTPKTSPSHRIYGMSVAILAGLIPGALKSLQKSSPAIDLKNLVLIGQRDLDAGEKELIRSRKLNAFTMKEIDLLGIGEVAKRAIEIASKDTEGFIVSFDLDVCDPTLTPGTQTQKRGGLTFREAHLLMELIFDSKKMLSFEVVELNPTLDKDSLTAEMALSLVESAVGKSIL